MNSKMATRPAALPVAEFAHEVRCSRAHIYNLIRAGEIRVIKLGSSTRIPVSELDRLLAGGGDAA